MNLGSQDPLSGPHDVEVLWEPNTVNNVSSVTSAQVASPTGPQSLRNMIIYVIPDYSG